MDSLKKYRELEEDGFWEATHKFIKYDTDIVSDLSQALLKGTITKDQLRAALDRGEIKLIEYVKIVG